VTEALFAFAKHSVFPAINHWAMFICPAGTKPILHVSFFILHSSFFILRSFSDDFTYFGFLAYSLQKRLATTEKCHNLPELTYDGGKSDGMVGDVAIGVCSEN
jgi:hypothetical protein